MPQYKLAISDDTINQVKDRTNIIEIIGEYVNLKASGKNYKGLCPFHSEKTPSFMVSPDKGIFHCFGCGAGGNVFTFLMKFKGISFPDAVKLLGGRAGIQIRNSYSEKGIQSKLETIYNINKETTEIYEKNLFSENGKKALEYLKKRNFDPGIRKSFHIGYANDSWDSLLTLLRSRGYGIDLIEESGLIVKKKKGTGFYDRFRNRIIFPIQDNIDRVIGFGGRTFDNNDPDIPKYINSNENLLYHKGKYLYGFNNAADSIRQADSAFIVEGYIDVIRMHKEGIKNTVAPLGTALTEDQISLIMRYTRKIYLAFDSDDAGEKAMLRSISLMHRQGLDPSVICLPSGKDPGDFFDEYITDDFDLFVDEAVSGIDYIVNVHIDSKKEYNANEKITILQELVEYFNNMNDDILKIDFLKKISSALEINENILRQELIKLTRRATTSSFHHEDIKKKDTGVSTELYLLLLILSNPDLLPIAAGRLDDSYFHGKWTRKLWNAVNRASENTHWDSGTVFDYLDDGEFIEYLSGKLIEDRLNINPESQIIDVVSSLKEKRIRERIAVINMRLMKAELENNDNLTNELIVEKQVFSNELEKMKILRGSKSRL